MKFLSSLEPYAFAALRIVAGFMFACHGAQKLLPFFGGPIAAHRPLMLAAGVIELGGGILILVGFLTRFAAFIASGEMAVGYFLEHAPKNLFSQNFFPLINKGELGVLYCFVFLFIACHGAGKLAVDKS